MFFDRGYRKAGNIDQAGGALHPHFHQVDKIRPAPEELDLAALGRPRSQLIDAIASSALDAREYAKGSRLSPINRTYRRIDIRVGAAAADIAGHPFSDFIIRQVDAAVSVGSHRAGYSLLNLGEHCDGGADLTRRAISALETIEISESSLHGMEFAARSQAFDSCNVIAIGR